MFSTEKARCDEYRLVFFLLSKLNFFLHKLALRLITETKPLYCWILKMPPSSRLFTLLYNVLRKWGLCRLIIHSLNYYPTFPGNLSTSWTISTKSSRTVEVLEILLTTRFNWDWRKFNGHLLPLLVSLATLKITSKADWKQGIARGFLSPL